MVEGNLCLCYQNVANRAFCLEKSLFAHGAKEATGID